MTAVPTTCTLCALDITSLCLELELLLLCYYITLRLVCCREQRPPVTFTPGCQLQINLSDLIRLQKLHSVITNFWNSGRISSSLWRHTLSEPSKFDIPHTFRPYLYISDILSLKENTRFLVLSIKLSLDLDFFFTRFLNRQSQKLSVSSRRPSYISVCFISGGCWRSAAVGRSYHYRCSHGS